MMLIKAYNKIFSRQARIEIGKIRRLLHIDSTRHLYNQIISFYGNNYTYTNTEEEKAVEYLKAAKYLEQYPATFIEKYDDLKFPVYIDEEGYPYIVHKQSNLFFPKGTEEAQVEAIYKGVLLEQDPESPHCYFTDTFNVKEEDVFFDIGCAEGLIALDCVKIAKHVFIFECDSKWIEPLKKTFAPWNEKVTITQKFVSNIDSDDQIRIDTFAKEHLQGVPFNGLFLKIDVEGADESALLGSEDTLKKDNVRIAICTYHKNNDALIFEEYLKRLAYKVEFSKNYMVPFTLFVEEEKPPYLRKGVLRAMR